MLHPDWRSLRRLLVMRLDNIGDMVMLTPALRALRQALPEVDLTLLASPAGHQLAPLLPWVNQVMPLRSLWQDASGALAFDPEREQELIKKLRQDRFDATLIFTSFSQSPYPPAYVAYLAGIPLRLGQSKEFGGRVLSDWVKPPPDDSHQVDRNLHLLQAIGIAPLGRHLELAIPAVIQTAADRCLHQAGVSSHQPFILLAPGASCAARCYDPERYREVARLLATHTNLPIVVVGSEREGELVAPILALQQEGYPIASLVGQTSVPELAAVIRRASLVIGNNSGPMHLADAFRRPLVILFSGTDRVSQWRPRNAPTILLQRSVSCSPCYGFRCPYNLECLDIAPAEVVQGCLDLLQTTLGARPAVQLTI
mgnify:CR=1 FL=1